MQHYVERDLGVRRLTAAKYPEALSADGFLLERKIGRSNCCINIALYDILTGEAMREPTGR